MLSRFTAGIAVGVILMSIYGPVKIYDKDNRKYSFALNRTKYLLSKMKNKKILHVGCADYPLTESRMKDGSLLHSHLTKYGSSVVGIDLSDTAIKILSNKGYSNVQVMDAESITIEDKFDVVFAGDVLEHMNNPGLFLNQIEGLLYPNGRFIVCVPNAFSFNFIKYIIGMEPTHKDHTFHFSVKSITELCSRFNLLPTKLTFTVQPTGRYEKKMYIAMRNVLIRMQKKAAPSFIIEFQLKKDTDLSVYYEWQ